MEKDDLGLEVPQREIDGLARLLLPKIQQFFESAEGQKEFAEWKRNEAAKIAKEA